MKYDRNGWPIEVNLGETEPTFHDFPPKGEPKRTPAEMRVIAVRFALTFGLLIALFSFGMAI